MRYVLKALFWTLLLCGLFFYPYAPGSWPSHAIDSYLRGLAHAAAFVIQRFVLRQAHDVAVAVALEIADRVLTVVGVDVAQ